MITKIFNLWPADGYTHPVLLSKGRAPEQMERTYEQLARPRRDAEPIGKSWAVEDFEWDPDDKELPRAGISTTAIGVPCLPASLADSVFPDRHGFELLPIRVAQQDWLIVHPLGVVDATVDLDSSELIPTTVPGQHVYKWVNLVHPQPLLVEFLRLRGSVYGPHVTESFVDRVNSLGLKGLQFELIGHVIEDASQAVARPAPPPEAAATGKRRRQPRLTAKPLPIDESEELEEVGRAMRTRWRIGRELSTEASLEALKAQIQQLRLKWFECSKEEQVDALLGLASIFGELICSAHGWSWAELRQGRDLCWIAVLSPQGSHALALVPYLRQQIDRAAPTTTLLFNMIGAGSLPPAEPGQVVSIG